MSADAQGCDALVRLYDVAPPGPGGPATRRATPADRAPVLRLADRHLAADERWRIELAMSDRHPRCVVAGDQGDRIDGFVAWDAPKLGVLGPLVTSGASADVLTGHLQVAACRAMEQDGYWYAVLPGEAGRPGEAGLAQATVPRASPRGRPVSERDIPEVPWADLFLPLDDALPYPVQEHIEIGEHRVTVRRPVAAEHLHIARAVEAEFGAGWAGEIAAAMARRCATCFVATTAPAISKPEHLVGFKAWDVSGLGVTGPFALTSPFRGGWEISGALILNVLEELRAQGYAYAVLGGVGRRTAPLRFFPDMWAVPGSYPSKFPIKASAPAPAPGESP